MTDEGGRDEGRDSDADYALSRRSALAGTAAAALGGLAGCATELDADDAAGTQFGGFEHAALGGASLEVQEESLVVSGVETAGDGVATNLGRTVEWATDAGATVEEMVDGATLTATAIGNVEGNPGEVATTIRMTRDGRWNVLEWDYPIANGNVAVEVLDENGPVHFEEVGTSADVAFAQSPVADTHIWFLAYVDDGTLAQQLDGVAPAACTYEFSDPSGRELTVVVEGVEYTGTSLRVMEIPGEDTADVWYTSEHRLTGTDVGTVVMDHETADDGVMFDRLSNEPVGDGAVERLEGAVRITDTFAADGALVELGEVAGCEVRFDGIGFSTADSELLTRGVGTVGGEGYERVGKAGVAAGGDGLDLFADFRALDTEAVGVEVLANGDVIASDTVGNGVYGLVHADPLVVGAGIVPNSPPGLFHVFDTQVPIELPGDGAEGDEVRAFPVEPGRTVDSVSEFEILGTDFAEILVTGEEPIAITETGFA